jgi:NitT/TauT family transport system ATP-binding protein
MIKVTGLYKQFEQPNKDLLTVLDNISFETSTGSITGIVGQSGCGKSTLLEIIAGLQTPTNGIVFIENDITPFVLFQQYNKSLFPYLTVKKNVEIALHNENDKEKKSLESLELVGLKDFSDYYPWQISGGMQQRVCIARALAKKASILLLDEPFSSLDTINKHKLEDDLLSLIQDLNMTCLYVTHDIDSAIYFSDKVIVLNKKPAFIIDEFSIELGKDRNQIETKKSNQFLKYREEIYYRLLEQ